MNPLYLDIETTGLPPKGSDWRKDYMSFPFIVEIAWIFEEKINSRLIYPEYWMVPESSTAVHGITHAVAMEQGEQLTSVLCDLIFDAEKADKIIAHNIYFDTSILQANTKRDDSGFLPLMEQALHKSKRIDTMRMGQRICNKWPTLEELYVGLTGKNIVDNHRAANDVIAVKICYEEMVRRGF